MQRKHIQVFGTVQGVGFRFYTERIAREYNIKGTVQNVEDYVDIYAQGNNKELEQFIQSVIKGASPASSVTNYTIEDLDTDDSLTEFKTI
ncbi:acylphosphatase [Staphylococcus caprae]|uniref:acylphosphatase n=1 Tax=Staphylococcus caprae TaxID=29380 RepID=A0ABN5W3T5_9STAP|nr:MULTISPECIES: acylphosphatase [Staphylococcus]EES40273.1 acylphosphatase [Staphylococcus caprae M23864:W1]MBN6825559.1 acylphosphatase [Staphylococcus caprae]MBX5316085.1 acylphosphatase [Staphylococcus caprae]MBX5323133.1 acylphosphatase [Staphylococcus caprae]MDI0013786.1 acylphosphatase [Staphylococcus caprae]